MTETVVLLLLFLSLIYLFFFLFSKVSFENPLRRFSKSSGVKVSEEEFQKRLREYEENFIFVTPQKLKSRQQSYSILFGMIGLPGFFGGAGSGVFLCLILALAGYFLPLLMIRSEVEKRRKAFASQILDMLETVSNALKAGLSFPQALEAAAEQTPDPMGEELHYLLRQNSLGVNLDDALTKMAKRMKNDNFSLVVSAVTVTRQLGGNLPEIFKSIGETLREREMMEGKIVALTSQGRMQAALMGAMPFLLMIGIYFLDKKTILPLFTTPMGWMLLTVMILLNAVGFVVIKKIVDIDI